jgi:hypothetical protein
VTAGAAEPTLSVADALERLRDPRAPEAFSPLGGAGLLLVDLAGEARAASAADLAAARAALAQLPCPTLALHAPTASPAGAELAPAFDVVARDAAELAPVIAAVRRTPLASLGLVQLLRHSEGLAPHQGLVAESLVYSMLQGGPELARWLVGRAPSAPPPSNPRPAVRLAREGDRLHLTLDRPERHNAFSTELRDALCEALELAVADRELCELLLDGAGPSFSSGGDLVEFGTHPDPATAHAVRSTRSPARLLAALAPRVTAVVHGACVGAGVELPAFSARVIAKPGAWFQLPEVGMGLVPGAGGTVSIPRRIGRQRTAWLALSGERIDAEAALAWGLVDAIRG